MDIVGKVDDCVRQSDTERRNSSVVEQSFRKAKVAGSIPVSGSVSSLWVKSKFANLVKYAPSGQYYCRAKVNGRALRICLKTKSEEIAKLKLDDLLKRERLRAKRRLTEDQSLGVYAGQYLAHIAATASKPRAADYRAETWEQVKRTWSGITDLIPRRITKADCEAWAKKARAHYSATRFNGALETLRNVFKAAIKDGACLDDPTENINRASVTIDPPKIPNGKEFQELLATLDDNERTKPAALVVRLLAFTGLRINEARHLRPEDIDLKAGWLHARITKNGEPRRVPIIGEARPVLKEWAKVASMGFSLIDPRRALRTASKTVGLNLTPHDLRHLFATKCLERGVDVRTVAGWLGHKDGGALLLKRYAHLTDHHSLNMAKKVRFG